jgi:PAS domain S-box-containing protein
LRTINRSWQSLINFPTHRSSRRARDNPMKRYATTVTVAIVLGLYLSSLHSYLLFHSLIEIFTISIAFTLFILTWNTRGYLQNNYLRLLGIGYAFIAVIDLLHTLAYKGMNVFPGYGANLPTQLWIAARYLQAFTLFAAPFFLERRMDNRVIFGGYAAVVSALVAMVYSGNFPDCFIEGKGLTMFKIGSEYMITFFLIASLYLLYRKRKYFDNKVFFLIAASIVCTVLSEISFTAYVSVYGFANLVGHFAKLAAFYLIYQAILVTGLKEPFDLIFRDLKQAEEALRRSQDSLEEKVTERTAELRASEQRYHMAEAIGHVGNWEYNLQTTNFWGSDEAKRIYGFDPEALDFSTDEVENCIPERVRIHQALVDLIEREKTYNLEFEIHPKNSSEPTIISSIAELKRDEHGNPLLVTGVIQDITERKRAEDALQRLNRELRAVSICNQTLLRTEDEQTLLNDICRIVCDEAGYRMAWVGYAEDDEAKAVRPIAWAGVEDGYFADPDITWADTERGRDPTGIAIRTGETDCIRDFATEPKAAPWRDSARQRGYRSSIALPLKDESKKTFGTLTIYSTEFNAFTPDEIRLLEELSGDLAFGITVLRGRIERKQTEEKSNQLAAIVQSSDDAIIGKTLKGIVTSWNRGAEKIYGYTESEMIGKPISDLIPPEYENELPQIMIRIEREEYIEHYETVRRRKDGRIIDVSLTISPIYDFSRKIIGASTIARDVTERKQAEQEIRILNEELEQRVLQRTAQLNAANEELETFAYSVSHDLRAPLRGIDGWSLALLEDYGDSFDDQARKYLDRVRTETQLMGKLIDDMLKLSRVIRVELQLMPIDFTAMARSIATRLQEEWPDRRIEFIIQPALRANGDNQILDIALYNLFDNAVKFTGRRTLARIEFGEAEVDGEKAFFVRDNGVGFDMAYADKLFGAFQRLHKLSEFPGTGIGLATVQRIIHRHGGRIWTNAQVDQGATFYFTLKETI